MTQFIVLDETRRNPDLRDRVLGVLDTVAPLVAEITDLPLPATVRFRLLAPKAWREEVRLYQQRTLAKEIGDLEPPEIKAGRVIVKVAGFTLPLVWPLVLGSTQEAKDGQCETISTPATWRHAGVLASDPALHQVIAHELVHQVQREARSGAVWTSLFPHKHGLGRASRKSISYVLEGHADWADRMVTTRLFDTPADHRKARKSWRYRLHDNPLIRRLGPSREAYELGGAMIERAVELHGTHTVNRVWEDVSLLPRRAEIADPDAWVRRLHQD
ncbi:zinc-dependent metalloprotease [Streptomyces sp. NPDC057620]|uniref:zinc-dependent metalloprotease n=1 Tax=Streptomyces sp. NPDC057620 TaxID=3346185 RepID=UPI00369758B5